MTIGNLHIEQIQTAVKIAKTLSELEHLSPGVIEQVNIIARYECRYDGIIEFMFDNRHSDEQVARIYGLTQQSVSRMRYKVGARKTMRDFDLAEALLIIDHVSEEEAIDALKIKPQVYTILKNRGLLGTDTDFAIGKQLGVGYTHVYFWRMKLGIPSKAKGWQNKLKGKKHV